MNEEIKVSELDLADEIRDTDQLMIVQGGINKKAPAEKINDRTISDSYGISEEKGYSQRYINGKFDENNFQPYTSWTRNTTYISATGYMNCYKNNKLCSFNGNFKIDPAPTDKNIILIENLPIPKNRITTFGVIEEGTTVRFYIDTNGKLYTDSKNYIVGWINFNIMYPLA